MTLKKVKKNFDAWLIVFFEDQMETQTMAKILGGCSTSPTPPPDEPDPEDEEENEIDPNL